VARNVVRRFVRHTPNAKIVELLDAARQGKVTCFKAGTCLVDSVYGRRAWMDRAGFHFGQTTYHAWVLLGFRGNERSFSILAGGDDRLRNRRLVPIILAEVKRRNAIHWHSPAVGLAGPAGTTVLVSWQ